MTQAIVIRGRYAGGAFVPDEPMPAVEGTAELIVFPASSESKAVPSIFDLFGRADRLRSAADIDAQIREEREVWGDS